MAQALQIRRGLKAALPAKAALGEPLIATDTRELYVGQGLGASDGGVYKVGDVVFSDAAPAIEAEKIWIDTTNNAIYRADVTGTPKWVACSAVSTGGDTVLTDFTVYGVTQGSYSDGMVITAGTSLLDVVKGMLQTVIPASYMAPGLSLGGSAPTIVEAGTSIAPVITPSFLQRDGGAPTVYVLKKDGADVLTNTTAIAFNDIAAVLGDATVSFQAFEDYGQGPVKNDNQGNPSPAGQIAAGTAVSNVVAYTGKRGLFYGHDTVVTAPIDSAGVRALATKVLGPANGTSFTLSIPAGTTRIVFAYPDTLRDVSSVKYVELGNAEVKDTFAKTAVNVEGADGFTAIGYKIFSYVPAVPFGDAVTYQVVI